MQFYSEYGENPSPYFLPPIFFFFGVEVFFGEFPDEALGAVFAVEFGAATGHAPLAEIDIKLFAPEAGGQFGVFGTLHL